MGSVQLDAHPPAAITVGQDLLDAMLDAGVPAMYLCMAGSCGRCRVRVTSGYELLSQPNHAERHHGCLGPERLACQASLASDGDVRLHQ